MNVLEGKHIILGVSGGIAAYKSVELLRLLRKAGAQVRVIMTRNARWFVGALTFEALSGAAVCTSLFKNTQDAAIRHIQWAEEADAVIIAPATANIVAKLTSGLADDALSTFMLAVRCPIILCPSMNTYMYESKIVQRNLRALKSDGYIVVEPESGALACGTVGPGRLPEPEVILEKVIRCLWEKDLLDKRILITAGPTIEPLDPVRFISNASSGKMGYALANAALRRGATVTLVTGPTSLAAPMDAKVVRVQTAADMARAVSDHVNDAHIIIKTAAVCDYRPVESASHKLKKHQDELILRFEKTVDILKGLGDKKKGKVLVGFAAETESLNENARQKLAKKNLDMIVGNLISAENPGFRADTNTVTLFYKDGTSESLPSMKKEQLAHIILDRIIERILTQQQR
ncbi:MAG: bifunctional phosphopantothenoylcysteine decarboxylase/phosphopantothenate--cysteine ligase CoaBC [Deltaproteobacteria bacterium]|nr:bifunctional phosphopantothenoylcysteine decarboxylase/phosphopantothenate--cysteine ligase CoaBC [Deltaproteobacteria bacterium]MBW1960983.1 bifunctional phosphopantothenoylcysteine decarboxylase/phosphopantothenate--cysteine ligase CoaBC [Deltaproteobacteria bacterium]MBW2151546.1 bifunctional phosphopantothenoylcysteine decarboxylase/phosphopantothenate--cysteine ligase CoaBC [Deltaproteobacteria bacterium]